MDVSSGDVADAPDYCRIANRRAPRGGFTRRLVHQDVLSLIVCLMFGPGKGP